MRLLHIIADGNPGGGTTHVLHLLRYLKHIHAVALLTQTTSYLHQEAQSLGLLAFGIDFFRHRLNPTLPWRVHRIITQFRPDLLHVHGGRAGLWSALAMTELPMLYTVHGFHLLHKSPLMRRLAIVSERVVIRRASRTIFVSHHDAQIAQEYRLLGPRQQSAVIYNGIDLSTRPLTAPHSAPTHLGFIGRLEYQKDPGLFVEMMSYLPGYTATMVGGGALAAEVAADITRRGLETRVRLLGPLTHRDTLDVLPSLSALVMTSRWEGLPLVPLEAMWYGIPVVALDVGGLSEIIEDGRHGRLLQSRSAADLAQAVRTVTAEHTVRERIIQQARTRVQTLFSVDTMAASLQQVYETVVTEARSR